MAEPIDEQFREAVSSMAAVTRTPSPAVDVPVREGSSLTVERCLELFDAQLGSRHLDLAAKWLRGEGAGFYTIGSSGHEGNVAVAAALRPTDPALLHYRSGAFFLERARQVSGGRNALLDVLLGVVAAADDPISGGRHKVFGSRELAVIPQTSTIASHLPRAVGLAFALRRAQKLGVETAWPADAVTVCSFGDASASHSTAVGSINAAAHASYQGVPIPLLLVCEDNGLGISVPTPAGWIASAYSQRVGLQYFFADGCDLADTFDLAVRAAEWVRVHQRPAFLHLETVRLMGHAGSDLESAYRTSAAIEAEQCRDPLLGTARLLISSGSVTPDEILDLYECKRDEVLALAREAATHPPLSSAAAVMVPLELHPFEECCSAVAFEGAARGDVPLTLAQAINRALLEVLESHPEALVFGEDVARKGGVYGVTRGLASKVGRARVFDTLLDEQAILGLALGAGVAGLLPIPEIQYLAYLHNAEDQIRGEAATLTFFSAGRYRNPMVIRVAGFGYQKGFGGHFHNDNAIGVLRDIPGIVVASPARPDDAATMMRACVSAAKSQGAVCIFVEPIALYHTRDLHADGDNGWLASYPIGAEQAPIGSARTYGEGRDLTIVTFGNGLYLSLRVLARLERLGIGARVLDLRWLAPLPADDVLREAGETGRILIVDETRRSGGVSEGVIAALVDRGFAGLIARVTSADSFIPLGDAALRVLVSEQEIEDAAVALARRHRP